MRRPKKRKKADPPKTDPPKPKRKIDPAIARIRGERGLAVKIADALGIKRAAVYQWRRVPSDRVLTVAPLIDMTPKHIRPDVFAKP